MNQPTDNVSNVAPVRPIAKPYSILTKTLLVGLGVFLGLGVAAAAWYQYNFHASLTPVQLSAGESKTLEQKVEILKSSVAADAAAASNPQKTLVVSEREINGFLEREGLGDKIKVSMRNGQLAATALLPVDKEVPLIGGQTIRLKVALGTRLDAQHRLTLSLADISVGGISLPNQWLGGIKGLDLLADADQDDVLQSLAAGIKDFQVNNGEMRLVLND